VFLVLVATKVITSMYLLIPVKNFLSNQCTSSAFGDEPHRMLKVIQQKQPHILFGCAALIKISFRR
jgi:hypothetical protein